MLSRDESLKICETVLGYAKEAGAQDASVSLQNAVESHARFAGNRISTSGRSEDVDITATVWIEKRRAAITGNDPADGALRRLAADAVEIARISPVQTEYVPTLGPLDYPEARGFAASTADLDVAARAAALATVLEECRAAKVTGAGFHDARATAVATATANGNRRYFRSTEAAMSVTARSADDTGSGYYAGDHFDLGRLDAKGIAARAIDKAVQSREPKAIEPAAYPVILEPQAVADLLGFLVNAFDARLADEGRSAFSGGKDNKTRVGEKIVNERINLYSDPMHPDLPAVPATPEGIPAAKMPIITAGVLQNLDYSRYWAQQQKREPTPGPVNYIFQGADAVVSLDDMIKGMERGLLVSRFWYVRLVDPRSIALTGLTRDGLWWIEKGRISHPVRNLRFNQGVLAMLAPWNVEAIGTSQRLSPLVVPPLKLASFTFTSISDAI